MIQKECMCVLLLSFSLQQCNSDVCVCSQIFPSPELRPLVEASYRRHFFQKEHWTFYTEEPDMGPCILSIKPEADGTVYRCVCVVVIISGWGWGGCGYIGHCAFSVMSSSL